MLKTSLFVATLFLCKIAVNSEVFERKLCEDKYHLSWDVKDGKITFTATAETAGWVGLGINNEGSMKDAELVIAGVMEDVHPTTTTEPTTEEPTTTPTTTGPTTTGPTTTGPTTTGPTTTGPTTTGPTTTEPTTTGPTTTEPTTTGPTTTGPTTTETTTTETTTTEPTTTETTTTEPTTTETTTTETTTTETTTTETTTTETTTTEPTTTETTTTTPTTTEETTETDLPFDETNDINESVDYQVVFESLRSEAQSAKKKRVERDARHVVKYNIELHGSMDEAPGHEMDFGSWTFINATEFSNGTRTFTQIVWEKLITYSEGEEINIDGPKWILASFAAEDFNGDQPNPHSVRCSEEINLLNPNAAPSSQVAGLMTLVLTSLIVTKNFLM